MEGAGPAQQVGAGEATGEGAGEGSKGSIQNSEKNTTIQQKCLGQKSLRGEHHHIDGEPIVTEGGV